MNLKEAQEYIAKMFDSIESQTAAQVKTINLSCTQMPSNGPVFLPPTYVLTVEFETAVWLEDV